MDTLLEAAGAVNPITNITITGTLGSGKSSVCKILAKHGMNVISGGDVFRQVAEEKGVSVIELNRMAYEDKSIDKLVDERTTELGRTMSNTIFDARLAWHFVPSSFKVFLFTSIHEAAKRILSGENRTAESYKDITAAESGLLERMKLEKQRFKDIYGIDYLDVKNYNLIIESTCATPEEIAQEILRNFELYKQKHFKRKIELCLRNIYPTQSFRDFNSMVGDFYSTRFKKDGILCIEDSPIICEYGGYKFVIDGHHRVFYGLRAGCVFCTVSNIKRNDQVFKNCRINPIPYYYDFEDLGGFLYKEVPTEFSSFEKQYPMNIYEGDV